MRTNPSLRVAANGKKEHMLDEDEVGVLGKAVAAALAENLSADPVVKGLRTFVQTHPALGTTKLTDECLVRYYLSRKENYVKTKKRWAACYSGGRSTT